MTSPATQMAPVPFEDYLAMEASGDTKHEWINGLVYAMSRRPRSTAASPPAMVRALPETEECRVYSSDTLLYIEKAERSTYAGASIVGGAILTRGAKDRNGKSLGEAITNPNVVVVEALSKSTEHRDRNERFTLFQKIDSLEEYVLVSQDEPCIEVRRRSGRTWVTHVARAGETITIHGVPIAVDALHR